MHTGKNINKTSCKLEAAHICSYWPEIKLFFWINRLKHTSKIINKTAFKAEAAHTSIVVIHHIQCI